MLKLLFVSSAGQVVLSAGQVVLFIGDEVVQWNGLCLRGLTFEEVYDIMYDSKSDSQVELFIERPITGDRLNAAGISS